MPRRGSKTLTRADYERALKTYKGTASGPCFVEVKNRGGNSWRKYRPRDIRRIDWDSLDAARIHFADKAWDNGVPNEAYTTVVRVYPR